MHVETPGSYVIRSIIPDMESIKQSVLEAAHVELTTHLEGRDKYPKTRRPAVGCERMRICRHCSLAMFSASVKFREGPVYRCQSCSLSLSSSKTQPAHCLWVPVVRTRAMGAYREPELKVMIQEA